MVSLEDPKTSFVFLEIKISGKISRINSSSLISIGSSAASAWPPPIKKRAQAARNDKAVNPSAFFTIFFITNSFA
ncbi:hypothetical protein [Kallipyga massiliensis]|uniref:hypothetical protein n=1 Tax=Kallipyga massiliensis TaxID=1472764 RepID=UPI0026EE9D8B|nr:hypothetical protein [Kallipyga massiliensis]